MFTLKNFRTIALAEATTFLVLLVLTVVKYSFSAPEGVQIFGPIHGALFLAYFAMTFAVRKSVGWGFWITVLVLVGAILPFGGLIVDRVLIQPKLRTLALL